MAFIKIFKETYDRSLPLFDGNLQIHDGDDEYTSPYIEDSVELYVDLDDKKAKLRDLGAFHVKSNMVSEKEWHGRIHRWRARIRFISRSELASLILRLRPVLDEIFEQDEVSNENDCEVQRIMDDFITDSEYAEDKEFERQSDIIADRINFDEKLSPEWIEKNVPASKKYGYGEHYYDYDVWLSTVESITGEDIGDFAHMNVDVIQNALSDASKRIVEEDYDDEEEDSEENPE
jgi:hypothetical protein